MNQIEKELAAVCQSIAEDGQLTEHEVRYLAEWLTANPAACESSIGARLAQALNEILADGCVDEDELHRLAPIIGEAIAGTFDAESCELDSPVPVQSPRPPSGFVAGVKSWLAKRREKREREEFERREMERKRILARQENIREIKHRLRIGVGFVKNVPTFVTKANEHICWVEPGVLHEIKTVSRQYVGGYSGTRIRVAKGVSFSVGGSRGALVSEKGLIPTSSGKLIITTKRLAFVGDQKSIAVTLNKLIDVQVALDGIQFSETGKEHPKLVRFNSPNGDIVVSVMGFVLNEQSP